MKREKDLKVTLTILNLNMSKKYKITIKVNLFKGKRFIKIIK